MRNECPYCSKAIPPNAMYCPHCHSRLIEFEKTSMLPRYIALGALILALLGSLMYVLHFTGKPVGSEEETVVRRELDPSMKRQMEEDRRMREQREANIKKIAEGRKKAEERLKEQKDWEVQDKQAYFDRACKEWADKASSIQTRLLKKSEDAIKSQDAEDLQVQIDDLLEELDALQVKMDTVKELSQAGKVGEARALLETAKTEYRKFGLTAERFLLQH